MKTFSAVLVISSEGFKSVLAPRWFGREGLKKVFKYLCTNQEHQTATEPGRSHSPDEVHYFSF